MLISLIITFLYPFKNLVVSLRYPFPYYDTILTFFFFCNYYISDIFFNLRGSPFTRLRVCMRTCKWIHHNQYVLQSHFCIPGYPSSSHNLNPAEVKGSWKRTFHFILKYGCFLYRVLILMEQRINYLC